MNVYDMGSPNTPFAGGFKVAAAAIVIGLVVLASQATNDDVTTATLNDAAASATAATATDYFPSGYALNASESTPHIEAF